MPRHFDNWLTAFVKYASYTEAPKFMAFWSGVTAVAGALRRKVWFDQKRFRWTPNFFVVLVAPPGVATKSTTADVATDLLRDVPGINFGPNNITWQALTGAFAASAEHFQFEDEYHPMSAITLVARELGSLLDPRNSDMVNLLIELWDGARKYEKTTKMSGNDVVEGPWINIFGCTTPSWIANNVPSTMIGGGLMSRMIFLYAETKTKYVPYIDEVLPADDSLVRQHLVHDLEHIAANLCGPYALAADAREWGREWYVSLWKGSAENYNDDQIMGYVSRKQTHLHKLAMVMAAAQRDELVITLDDIVLAEAMLQDIEVDMAKVFAKVGRSETSLQTEKLLAILQKRGALRYDLAYREIHNFFPDFRDFEGVLTGLVRSGQVELQSQGEHFYIVLNGNTHIIGS